jgi:hypothetical protein
MTRIAIVATLNVNKGKLVELFINGRQTNGELVKIDNKAWTVNGKEFDIEFVEDFGRNEQQELIIYNT